MGQLQQIRQMYLVAGLDGAEQVDRPTDRIAGLKVEYKGMLANHAVATTSCAVNWLAA